METRQHRIVVVGTGFAGIGMANSQGVTGMYATLSSFPCPAGRTGFPVRPAGGAAPASVPVSCATVALPGP